MRWKHILHQMLASLEAHDLKSPVPDPGQALVLTLGQALGLTLGHARAKTLVQARARPGLMTFRPFWP